MLPFSLDKATAIKIPFFTFYFKGTRFQGNGELRWNPKEGLHLEATAESKRQETLIIEGGGGGPVPKRCFRFKIDDYWMAICPNVFFSERDEFLLLSAGTVSKDFQHLIFFSHEFSFDENRKFTNECYFKVNKNSIFPDKLSYEIKVSDEPIQLKESMQGLTLSDESLKLTGFLNDDGHFKIFWKAIEGFYSKQCEWQIPLAVRDALSICLGQTVHLLERTLIRKKRILGEIVKEREVINLGLFSPISYEITFEKELFSRLFKLFVKNDKHAIIVRQLFYRIADAVRTRNSDSWGFLICTALEAFLRTYMNQPFKQNKKEDTWQLEKSLTELRARYFIEQYKNDWRRVFKKVTRTYKELRHREAHPDFTGFIENKASELAFKESKERLEKVAFLCRFYGYVFRAFSGFTNLKPEL